jgi:glyoxylase-like metal-dependent hydrolase (beta-lactamase superfamily II)
LVDPGFDTDENRRLLESTLAGLGIALDDIATITATHLHHDHMGLGSWLSTRNDLPIALHTGDVADLESGDAEARYSDDLERMGTLWGVPQGERRRLRRTGIVPRALPAVRARPIEDGDILPIPGRTARVVHTPGHTRGHSCLAFAEEQVLFSGDHILPSIFPGIGLGGHPSCSSNPVADYLRSLDRLAEYDDHNVAPGHGFQFHGLSARRHEITQHVMKRAQNLEVSLALDPDASTWFLASTLTWRGGLGALHGYRLQSALTQTTMYADFVRSGGLDKRA